MNTLVTTAEKERELDRATYTTADVARLLNTSEKTVTRLAVPGRIKLNRLVRYARPAVDAWIRDGCPAH